ncbi:unnamed protein product [Darwinula stevensoni]|uniref:DNA-(apurinic or apyrimidinic site) lyase n=1 Tax=Darwinula stevensoni TaxID=69355 RepID=A0A7R8XGS5_9CRUS|nr:unnamed protein product [Darwinula stevensoni]CAG0892825.1 unnamed protein product [Darwinula stevensoni]
MVEGPGCKLKGENMKKRLVRQQVASVAGNALMKGGKKAAETSPFLCLNGSHLTDVKTVGKELFAFFDNGKCLRVHFLMSGWIQYNKEGHDKHFKKSQIDVNPTLCLVFNKDTMKLYKSSVEIRNSEDCEKRYQDFHHLDICSDTFDSTAAIQLMTAQSHRMVCDVIMDQDILPGVGNIIKNESWLQSTKVGISEWKCPQCTLNNLDTRKQCAACGHPNNAAKSDVMEAVVQKRGTSSHPRKETKEVKCEKHRKACLKKTVSKQGDNKGRLFYTCSVQGKDKCNFFQWADEHHPVCNHGKRSVVRQVMKCNANNGREFYCCPNPKASQCEFFQWVS